MNLKDVTQPFKVEEFTVTGSNDTYNLYEIVYSIGDNEYYDLAEDPDKETAEIIAALLNMYCFSKIDLKVLDLDKLNMISFLISQINKLGTDVVSKGTNV